jgi:hypothetical protein
MSQLLFEEFSKIIVYNLNVKFAELQDFFGFIKIYQLPSDLKVDQKPLIFP